METHMYGPHVEGTKWEQRRKVRNHALHVIDRISQTCNTHPVIPFHQHNNPLIAKSNQSCYSDSDEEYNTIIYAAKHRRRQQNSDK
jgi:hypothetical protein